MTDDEYDVLDELYFVISFKDLLEQTSFDHVKLQTALLSLYGKKWIKVLSSHDEEHPNPDIIHKCGDYFYLATKKGLLAHTRGV